MKTLVCPRVNRLKNILNSKIVIDNLRIIVCSSLTKHDLWEDTISVEQPEIGSLCYETERHAGGEKRHVSLKTGRLESIIERRGLIDNEDLQRR